MRHLEIWIWCDWACGINVEDRQGSCAMKANTLELGCGLLSQPSLTSHRLEAFDMVVPFAAYLGFFLS